MKRFFALAVMMAAALAIGDGAAFASNKGLSGVWLMKFYSGPGGKPQPSLCIRFVQTNNVAGYKKFSGNWVSTTSSSLGGQWIQNGDDVMWYGANGNLAYFSFGDLISNGMKGGTGYAQFKTTSNVTQIAGTWTGQKTNRCTAADE